MQVINYAYISLWALFAHILIVVIEVLAFRPIFYITNDYEYINLVLDSTKCVISGRKTKTA